VTGWGRLLFVCAIVFASNNSYAVPSAQVRDCRIAGVDETLRCGEITVPENYQRPSGRQINLYFVVLPALQRDAATVPLFDLAGGPGIAGSDAAIFFATDGRIYRQHGDVVLLDQRGTGHSSPLHCPQIEGAAAFSEMYPQAAVRECKVTLEQHADLTQYTTANAARDLDRVRSALGYSRINLSGLSYGTRLALSYLRLYPQHVRAATLMGTVSDDARLPLWHARNAQNVLDQLIERCARASECSEAFPNLHQQWSAFLARSEQTPGTLPRGPMMESLRTLLVSADGQRRVPYLLDHLARSDFQPLRAAVHQNDGALAEGLYLSVTCAEDTAWITQRQRLEAAAGTFLGTYRLEQQIRACQVWKMPRVKVPGTGIHSEVPVLLIAGGADAVTPVSWARQMAKSLSRSTVVVVPSLAHFPDGLTHMECLDHMASQFLLRLTLQEAEMDCVSQMHALPFVTTLEEPPR